MFFDKACSAKRKVDAFRTTFTFMIAGSEKFKYPEAAWNWLKLDNNPTTQHAWLGYYQA